jgi:hypothetical protein
MPGLIGPIFSFLERTIDMVFDEGQLPETIKRWKLSRLKKAADEALANHDMVEHTRLTAELERLSDMP